MNRLVMHVAGLLFSFLCMAYVSEAQTDSCKGPCRDPGVWASFNVFELSLTIPGEPGKSSWNGRFDSDSNDIQIEVDIVDGRNVKSGKIMMIGGRVMAVRGPITEPGNEIDCLDAPILYYQLLTRVLAAALPNGPGISGVRAIDYRDEKIGIQFATPSAEGFIPAPWRVTGKVEVVGPDVVQYHLTLTSPRHDASPTDLNFSGKLSKVSKARIDDAVSLGGWTVFGVGVQTRKQGEGTIYDYGTGSANATYKTVADIRKKIERDDYPGEPDRSKDFTGFWKTNCDDAFGLSVEHCGTEGKYTVTFCGPGGCGDPAEERQTFINQDPEYQVISEKELRIGNAERRDTYYKCTSDTHPVLKYKHE